MRITIDFQDKSEVLEMAGDLPATDVSDRVRQALQKLRGEGSHMTVESELERTPGLKAADS